MSEDIGRSVPDGLSSLRDEAPSGSSPKASIPSARPRSNSPAVREAGIRTLAAECAAWGGGDEAEWITMLSRCYLHGNGFQIAKEIDSWHGLYDIDAELVEILDGASSHIWDAERAAVRAWVVENDIKPELECGTRLTCRHGAGVINGITADEGVYLFVPDKDAASGKFRLGGGIHLPYEDAAQAIEAQRAATAKTDAVEDESAVAKPIAENTPNTPPEPLTERWD